VQDENNREKNNKDKGVEDHLAHAPIKMTRSAIGSHTFHVPDEAVDPALNRSVWSNGKALVPGIISYRLRSIVLKPDASFQK
jgi:ribosomal protein L31E